MADGLRASRCPRCRRLVVPPASLCPDHPVKMEAAALPPLGEVISFTTLHSPPEGFRSPLHIALVELESKRASWVSKLSGGQKQRLAVACALVGDPDLLFLDEPTTGLDPQARRQLWDLLADFRHRNGTILITTHYMDEAEQLCDRLVVMDKARIVAEGSPRVSGRDSISWRALARSPSAPSCVTTWSVAEPFS